MGRFLEKEKKKMRRWTSLRRVTAQRMVSGHKMQKKERLTPLTLFTPRKAVAPVFRRPVRSQ